MNDTEKLSHCAYTLGFITGGLSRAQELNDWNIIKEMERYATEAAQKIFYDDACLKAMNKEGNEPLVDDKTKKCEHESDGSSHVFNYLDEKESFAMTCCKKCGAFYRPKKET